MHEILSSDKMLYEMCVFVFIIFKCMLICLTKFKLLGYIPFLGLVTFNQLTIMAP